MLALLSWVVGWSSAPLLLLTPSCLSRPPAVAAWWRWALMLGCFVPVLSGEHAALTVGALLGGAAGWILGGASPSGAGSVLAAVAAVVGHTLLDGVAVGGDPGDRLIASIFIPPAGLWSLSAGIAGRLFREHRHLAASLALVVLGGVVEDAGSGHLPSAGAALCVLVGGLLVLLHESLLGRTRPWWLLFAVSPLLIGLLRGPTAAGPYDHPPDLHIRQAAELELAVTDGAMISSLAALPDGRIAFGEFASGRVFLLEPETGDRRLLTTIALPRIEGTRRSYELGLWGLAAHPNEGWLYAMAIHRWDEEDPNPVGRSSRIVRVSLEEGVVETVRDGIPAGPVHAGGALTFEKDGAAFFASVGDGLRYGARGELEAAPNDAGTVLRLSADGGVPRDNPIDGSPVWARGFRNVYGMVISDPGELWVTENGPDCCDALLKVEPGDVHGWPPGAVRDAPEPAWTSGAQRLGPTGLATLGTRYGRYAGDLVFATWHTGALHRVRVHGGSVEEHEVLTTLPTARPEEGPYAFAGAFTGLSTAPDGTLWFSTLNAVGRVVSLRTP